MGRLMCSIRTLKNPDGYYESHIELKNDDWTGNLKYLSTKEIKFPVAGIMILTISLIKNKIYGMFMSLGEKFLWITELL